MKRLFAVVLIAAYSCPGLALASTETFAWHGVVARGHTLTIKNVNGTIIAEPAEGATAQVVALKHGSRTDPATVRIETVEKGGDVAICAVWPSSSSDEPNCDVAREFHVNNHDNDNDVRVDFTVRVPRGVNLVLRDVNGNVGAHSLSAGVDAATVNGHIDISTAGVAAARSVNGRLDVSMGTPPGSATSFATVNGSIHLLIPRATNAEFSAQTLNGSIQSDLPIQTQNSGFGRMSHASGRFGSGGPELSCKTLNGSITVHAQ